MSAAVAAGESARLYRPRRRVSCPRTVRATSAGTAHVQPHHRLVLVAALAAGARPVGRAALFRPRRRRRSGRSTQAVRLFDAAARAAAVLAAPVRRHAAGAGRAAGALDAGVPRLHALPGRLPDHAGASWRKAQKQWAPLPEATRPRVLFVSVDPERDTPRSHRRVRPRLPPRHPRRDRRRAGAGAFAQLAGHGLHEGAARRARRRPVQRWTTAPRWRCSTRRAAWPASSARRSIADSDDRRAT